MKFNSFGIALLLFLLGFALSEELTYFGRHFDMQRWEEVKQRIDCWSTQGSWVFNNKTIIDDISLYRKCTKWISYGPKNPCAWILDFKSLKYDWRDRCEVPRIAFNPHKMCKTMQGRSIVFVGDSVTHLFYLSMMEELLLASNMECNMSENFEYPCSGSTSFRIKYARNDELSLGVVGKIAIATLHSQDIMTPWEHLLGTDDVLVLNRGAHYHIDEEFIQGVNDTIHYVRHNFPNVSIIYRPTLPGVDYKHFVTQEPLTEKPVAANHFHWDLFEHQNKLVMQLLRTNYPEVLHLDVFSPTVLRQDAHYDELHYCVPGPLSTWMDLLYNALHLIGTTRHTH